MARNSYFILDFITYNYKISPQHYVQVINQTYSFKEKLKHVNLLGIRYQTAEDFAKRGARVILACRNEVKGQNAVEQIVKATDNKNVTFKQLNLSSFKSIREFAEDINATEARLICYENY